MNFYVLFIIVLRTLFVPLAVTLSDPLPSLICTYAGKYFDTGYILSTADVPDRCKTIMYSGYYMNALPMADSDIEAITSLISAGKIVYTTLTFPIDIDPHWDVILNSNFETTPNEEIENMIIFIKENKINGVVFDKLKIYEVVVPDYADKLKSLIIKIKTDIPTLKIGMYLNGKDYENFGSKDIFDFTVINDDIDFYVVDMASARKLCDKNTANTGRYVLSGGSYGVMTLEEIFQGIKSSPLDQSKIMINFFIGPSFIENSKEKFDSYSKYCGLSGIDETIWCPDSSQMFYDQVTFAKQFIKRLMLGMLDFDDFKDTCGCGKFPATNTYIDAWESKQFKCCEKIGEVS